MITTKCLKIEIIITTKCLKIEIIIMRHKRLAKFALIKYHINFQNYGIALA